MRRIRVMQVVTRLNIGGPASHIDLLCSRLDPGRFQPLLVAGREGPAEGSMVELGRFRGGVEMVRLPSLSREVSGAEDLAALRGVLSVARAFRPDIVHTHMTKAGLVGRLAARLARVPAVVHTFHGLIFEGYFGRFESSVYLNVERALARLTTRIIALTPGQRDELLRLGLGPPRRIVTIPLGLELEPFLASRARDDARRGLGLPASASVVGIVGRLVPIKDVDSFLRAVALVRERHPELIALVVGDGQERARLQALAVNLGLGGACRFLGWRADVADIYRACDVVALTSLSEGTPVSLIEAMATSRPVVATGVGGVPEVVLDRETGLIVPPADPQALARAIGSLLENPALSERLRTAGRRHVYPAYDVSRMMPRIEELYLGLAGRSP